MSAAERQSSDAERDGANAVTHTRECLETAAFVGSAECNGGCVPTLERLPPQEIGVDERVLDPRGELGIVERVPHEPRPDELQGRLYVRFRTGARWVPRGDLKRADEPDVKVTEGPKPVVTVAGAIAAVVAAVESEWRVIDDGGVWRALGPCRTAEADAHADAEHASMRGALPESAESAESAVRIAELEARVAELVGEKLAPPESPFSEEAQEVLSVMLADEREAAEKIGRFEAFAAVNRIVTLMIGAADINRQTAEGCVLRDLRRKLDKLVKGVR